MRKRFSQEERDAYNAQKREEANQQIVDLAKTWQDNPEDVAEFIRFQSRFHHYSARNKMLIYRQNPYASFVASMADFNGNGLLGASRTARNERFRVYARHDVPHKALCAMAFDPDGQRSRKRDD